MYAQTFIIIIQHKFISKCIKWLLNAVARILSHKIDIALSHFIWFNGDWFRDGAVMWHCWCCCSGYSLLVNSHSHTFNLCVLVFLCVNYAMAVASSWLQLWLLLLLFVVVRLWLCLILYLFMLLLILNKHRWDMCSKEAVHWIHKIDAACVNYRKITLNLFISIKTYLSVFTLNLCYANYLSSSRQVIPVFVPTFFADLS